MQTTIKLQDPFIFSIIPITITMVLVLAITFYLIYLNRKNKNTRNRNYTLKVVPERNIRNIPVIKEKYLKQLETIEEQYTDNIISLRKAYQQISGTIRMFVFEVTNIKTQNYSLKEIKELNIPDLYELIEEFYEPEFTSKPIGDFNKSIEKARRIIEKWN